MIKAITATKSTRLGSCPRFSMWMRFGLHSLLLAARNSTPYSHALREQQQCTKQRSIVPTDTWGAISSSSKSRAIAFFGRVYRLSANLFHQQVRMFLFGKSPV